MALARAVNRALRGSKCDVRRGPVSSIARVILAPPTRYSCVVSRGTRRVATAAGQGAAVRGWLLGYADKLLYGLAGSVITAGMGFVSVKFAARAEDEAVAKEVTQSIAEFRRLDSRSRALFVRRQTSYAYTELSAAVEVLDSLMKRLDGSPRPDRALSRVLMADATSVAEKRWKLAHMRAHALYHIGVCLFIGHDYKSAADAFQKSALARKWGGARDSEACAREIDRVMVRDADARASGGLHGDMWRAIFGEVISQSRAEREHAGVDVFHVRALNNLAVALFARGDDRVAGELFKEAHAAVKRIAPADAVFNLNNQDTVEVCRAYDALKKAAGADSSSNYDKAMQSVLKHLVSCGKHHVVDISHLIDPAGADLAVVDLEHIERVIMIRRKMLTVPANLLMLIGLGQPVEVDVVSVLNSMVMTDLPALYRHLDESWLRDTGASRLLACLAVGIVSVCAMGGPDAAVHLNLAEKCARESLSRGAHGITKGLASLELAELAHIRQEDPEAVRSHLSEASRYLGRAHDLRTARVVAQVRLAARRAGADLPAGAESWEKHVADAFERVAGDVSVEHPVVVATRTEKVERRNSLMNYAGSLPSEADWTKVDWEGLEKLVGILRSAK